jgi:hypothetical protein
MASAKHRNVMDTSATATTPIRGVCWRERQDPVLRRSAQDMVGTQEGVTELKLARQAIRKPARPGHLAR